MHLHLGENNNSKDVELRKLQDDLHRANKQHKDCEDEINNLKIKASDLAERNKFYLHGKIRMTAVYFGLDITEYCASTLWLNNVIIA